MDTGYTILATTTLITHALIPTLLIVWFMQKRSKHELAVYQLVSSNAFNLIFLSTIIATLGSLYFSEIAKFQPCILCWYQRIFMYPQPLLAFTGIFRDEARFLKPYLMVLNIGGLLFSFYHNFILWFPQYGELVQCSSKGGPSCIEGYKFYFGYITIPLMALTVFVFNIIILILFVRKPSKKVALPN